MKTLLIASALMLSFSAFAADFDKYGNLSKADQQFYKNDSFEGKNQFERTDSLVKEVNKVYGEMATMKAEIAALRAEVELLKNKK
jgi:peptidoglycan hydrolase CwlO-like protein